MYKTEETSHLVKNIPVSLWKKVRAKCLTEGINAVGDVIKQLLSDWVDGKIKYEK